MTRHAPRGAYCVVRSPYFWLAVAILLYVATFGALATREHLAFETGALDLGNYDQAMWNAAHGRGLALTTQPGMALNRLGLHVEPVLFLLVPLYWLWPGPLALLWAQTAALGLAAWPLLLLARRRLGSDWPALAVSLAYLLLPATEAVNLFDFHAVAFAPLFLLWAMYFLDTTGNGFWGGEFKVQSSKFKVDAPRLTLAFLFLILALSTKEDVSLHVFLLGLYLMVLRRRWGVGAAIAGLGLAWAFVAFGVVIPTYRVGGSQSAYVGFFPALGDTPLEIALSPLTRPLVVARLLARPQTIAALGMLTLPFAFLVLAGFPVLALAAPSLAITLLSSNPLQQQFETWHYAAPMLAFVSLAAAAGLYQLSIINYQLSIINYQLSIIKIRTTHYASRIAFWTLLLLAFAVGYHYLRGYSPLSRPFRWPEVTAHHRLGAELAAAIPPSARVVAQAELVPHLSRREYVAIWQGDFPAEADTIFVDVSHPKFINRDNAQANFLATMILEEEWGIVTSRDGYLLLRRGAARIPTQVGFQEFLFAGEEWAARPEQARFGDLFALVGVESHRNREAEPQVTLYFRVLRQPAEDYFIRLYLLNDRDEPEGATLFQQPALVWWPTHLWRPGDVIGVRFNTLPWWTGDGKHRRFGYAAGISRDGGDPQADPWNLSLRLPAAGQEVLPGNLVRVQRFYRLAGMVYATGE
ncbi:MAG: DUF2079 domain-containing protein [Anaerolineae bacterium]